MAARILHGFLLELDDIPGALHVVTARLAKAGVNIQGIGGMSGGGRATIGLVTENSLATRDVLRDVGASVRAVEYLAVPMADSPGELDERLAQLGEAGLNVVGLFPLIGDKPVLAFAVDDPTRGRAALRAL